MAQSHYTPAWSYQPLQTDQGEIWSTFGWKHSKKNPGATGSNMGDTVGGDLSSESVLHQLPSMGQGSSSVGWWSVTKVLCGVQFLIGEWNFF